MQIIGLLFGMGGLAVAYLGLRQLPEAAPAGFTPEIVHIVDFQDDPPRANYLHVLGGHYLPFASLALSPKGSDTSAPAFFLIPLVDERHALKREMERVAAPAIAGEPDGAEGWNQYVAGSLDYSEIRLLVLSTDVSAWLDESAISVESAWVEGVVRDANDALDPDILSNLEGQFSGVAPNKLAILYENEAPPEEEVLRLVTLVGSLFALLGIASFVASFFLRRRGWLR